MYGREAAGSGHLIEEDRPYAHLLSSQPLCFNVFGELQADLGLATRPAPSFGGRASHRDVTTLRFGDSRARRLMAAQTSNLFSALCFGSRTRADSVQTSVLWPSAPGFHRL